MRLSIAWILLVAFEARSQQIPETVLRGGTQEVLLDFVVRDKHQNLIKDLAPSEVSVYEDGVKQTPRSFHFTRGEADSAGVAKGADPLPQRGGALDPMREVNLVTVVFERMSSDGRRQATQAVQDFLRSELRQNTFVGVFVLSNRLSVLQTYTRDQDALRRAVDRAAYGAYQQFAKDSERTVQELNGARAAAPHTTPNLGNGFDAMRPGSAEERGPDLEDPTKAAREQLFLRILYRQTGVQTIDALRRLVRAQAELPGRKTVLFLSEGLVVPPEEPEGLRNVVSEANRANITFYTVDARGLTNGSSVRQASAVAEAFGNASGSTGTAGIRTNLQANLRNLAEETGGFAMANSNDLRAPLQHVMQDVRSHYEFAYAPTSTLYDGHFRTIEVKLSRPGLKVQSRRGYFALPEINGQPVAPFELAALTALNASVLPNSFPFRAAALRFRPGQFGVECRVVFQVKAKDLKIREHAQSASFQSHISVVALVKNDQGEIVAKVTRDLPVEIPMDRRADFAAGEVTITLPVQLTPGRYQVEFVTLDRIENSASVRKSVLVIPAEIFGISDPLYPRGVQPDPQGDGEDPLRFGDMKITPELHTELSKRAGKPAQFFLWLYASETGKPELQIDVMEDGKTLATIRPELTGLKAETPFPYRTQIPLDQLRPGPHHVQFTFRQGDAIMQRQATFTVEEN